jgi:phage protein D
VTDAALVSGAEVRLNGTPLDPTLAAQILEIRVDTHMLLPDMLEIRIADPQLDFVDDPRFSIGKSIQVLFGAPGQRALTSLFKGQIVSLEPEFASHEVSLTVRAYDRSHQLNRSRNTETYQSMSVADIARKVASRAGLSAGHIDAPSDQLDFVQQSNETDWAFLWRLAAANGCEVEVDDRQLNFAPPQAGSAPVELSWGNDLLSFRPRVTGVQQVQEVIVRGWDPQQKQPIIATASAPQPSSEIGIERSQIVSTLGGGTITIADRPVLSQAEAQALADSVSGELADSFVEAEGLALGDPRLSAGAKIRVTGIGTRFGGVYELTESTHVFRTGRGYHCELRTNGRQARTFSELTSPAPASTWHHSIAVAQVTNNNDPQGMGRVRVKYPALDPSHEGWWARITAPSAGANRGLMMLPQPGDEVLVAFEHDDDEHPCVIGSVWNGQDRPQELAMTDGSLAMRSDAEIVAQATGNVSLKTGAELALEAQADATIKATGALQAQAEGEASLQAQGALTLKGGAEAMLQAGAAVTVQGAMVTVSADGEVTVSGAGVVNIQGAEINIIGDAMVAIQAPKVQLG